MPSRWRVRGSPRVGAWWGSWRLGGLGNPATLAPPPSGALHLAPQRPSRAAHHDSTLGGSTGGCWGRPSAPWRQFGASYPAGCKLFLRGRYRMVGSLAAPGHVSKHQGAASYHPTCWAHRPPQVLGLSLLWSLWASTHLPQGLITWTVQCGLGVQGVPTIFL